MTRFGSRTNYFNNLAWKFYFEFYIFISCHHIIPLLDWLLKILCYFHFHRIDSNTLFFHPRYSITIYLHVFPLFIFAPFSPFPQPIRPFFKLIFTPVHSGPSITSAHLQRLHAYLHTPKVHYFTMAGRNTIRLSLVHFIPHSLLPHYLLACFLVHSAIFTDATYPTIGTKYCQAITIVSVARISNSTRSNSWRGVFKKKKNIENSKDWF